MGDYILLFIGCIFVNNILLMQYLGNCPFLGVSKKMDTAIGMAMAVIFVLVMAGAITWVVEMFLLKPYGFEFLRTMTFILVIASLVQFVEMFLRKSIPALYAGLGIFLPLITTNCAVLGVALINLDRQHGLLESLVFGAAAGAGFGIALLAFAALRERLETADVPEAFRGAPLALVTAGLMALAFMGFGGLGGR